jgi:hypothetical protein
MSSPTLTPVQRYPHDVELAQAYASWLSRCAARREIEQAYGPSDPRTITALSAVRQAAARVTARLEHLQTLAAA